MLIIATTAPAHATALGSGLRLIQRNYLFATELDAQRLLGEALDYVEARIPEVLSEPGADGGHVLRAGPCRLFLEVRDTDTLADLEDPLRHAAALVDRCVTDPPEKLEPTQSLLLKGILSGLDPYSTVFDAERKTEHTIQFRGKLAGIGARIGVREDKLTLITVYEGSPAWRSGLRDRDVVARIDGMSTTNLAVTDAVQRIRGKVATDVALEIEREGQEVKTYTVTRGLVTIPSVKVKRLDGGVIYASISHFSQTTPTDFKERVGALAAEDTFPAGIVIDLRTNSGGSMIGSSSIGDLFLDDALLITTAGRSGYSVSGLTAEIRATDITPFRDYPVVFLTSPRTASGSELLAASLRNNDRAIVIGERSFGKGTVQKTYSLSSDSSLKLTVGHFLPNGLAIPGGGMQPDVETRRFVFGDKSIRLPSDRTEEDPDFWLATPKWLSPEPDRDAVLIDYAEEIENPDPEAPPEDNEKDASDEPIVKLAAELLARYGNTSAEQMMRDARLLLHRRAREADREVEAFMKKRGLEWELPERYTPGKRTEASVTVAVTTDSGTIRAGEKEEITISVTNDGSAPIYRAYGIVRSEAFFLRARGVPLGNIAPGESKSHTLTVEVPPTERFARASVRIELHDAAGFVVETERAYLAITETPQPVLAQKVKVTQGETENDFDIEIEFRNDGTAEAEEVRAFLRHPDAEGIELLEGTATVDSLAPGASARVKLVARTLSTMIEAESLELIVSEKKYRLFLSSDVELSPTPGKAKWVKPPQLALESLVNKDGVLSVVARITDDDGIVSVLGAAGGDQSLYIDSKKERPTEMRITLPWPKEEDARSVVISATDDDGLTSQLTTDL